MIDRKSMKLIDARYLLVGSLVLILLTAFPLAALAGLGDGSSYSGDDAYDPAAGGFPELYMSGTASLSGDDAYDLAAGAIPERGALVFASGFGGDDAYDPAAGGLPAVSLFSVSESLEVAECDSSGLSVSGGFSGDDAYDPAAGGNPGRLEILLACLLTP
ncbi:MAG: hypothetical protein ACK2UU_10505 [Anaerolineae bacterium]|jgi:hypothetical protein